MANYPDIMGDESLFQKPMMKTQLMNSIRAACRAGVNKRILENKFGNSFRIIQFGRRPVAGPTGEATVQESSDVDDDCDSDEDSDALPKKTYSHVTLEAVSVSILYLLRTALCTLCF